MATIHDVAREAGVSIATVSRVLQGSSKVLPETQERINEAIQRLNYRPNRLAQQFRSQETKNILVIVPEIGNTFYSDVLAGIKSVAVKKGYSVLIVDSNSDPVAEKHFYDMLVQKQVDGIIAFSTALPTKELQNYTPHYPVVIGCRYVSDGTLPSVTIDNEKASCDITKYILSLGHKNICCLAGPADTHVYRSRLKGFRDAVSSRGIEVPPSRIVRCEANIQGGYDATVSLINSGEQFTAIIASGDTMAVGAIRALTNYGYRVPDDVAVVGFDDIELSRLFSPTLTTVRQPKFLIGSRAMDIMLDLLAGRPLLSYRTVLDYELVIRESSGSFV